VEPKKPRYSGNSKRAGPKSGETMPKHGKQQKAQIYSLFNRTSLIWLNIRFQDDNRLRRLLNQG